MGTPDPARGTLTVRTIAGRITIGPRDGRTVLLGRESDEVHVPLGVDDLGVSRQHVLLTSDGERWWVRNVGRNPVRLPMAELYANSESAPLAPGATTLLVVGSGDRVHQVDLWVAGSDGARPPAALPTHKTFTPTAWDLTDTERLVLTVLGQRYLRREPGAQPMPWRDVAAEVGLIDGEVRWSWRKAAKLVTAVRERLSVTCTGLLEHEVPRPLGNQLNHNLIIELVRSHTLTPTDLALLDGWAEEH